MTEWDAYHAWTAGREVRPLFRRAWELLEDQPPGSAIDIGFGDGTETRSLLARGWSVRAIDSEPRAAERLREDLSDSVLRRLTIVTSGIEEAQLPPSDFVYAGFSLPFCRPDKFHEVWRRIVASIAPAGLFAGQLFGDRDGWVGDPSMTFLRRQAAESLLEPLDVLSLEEEDQPGDSFSGPKHWHVFHVLARAAGG